MEPFACLRNHTAMLIKERLDEPGAFVVVVQVNDHQVLEMDDDGVAVVSRGLAEVLAETSLLLLRCVPPQRGAFPVKTELLVAMGDVGGHFYIYRRSYFRHFYLGDNLLYRLRHKGVEVGQNAGWAINFVRSAGGSAFGGGAGTAIIFFHSTGDFGVPG